MFWSSIAVLKHHGRKKLEEQRAYFILYFTVLKEVKHAPSNAEACTGSPFILGFIV